MKGAVFTLLLLAAGCAGPSGGEQPRDATPGTLAPIVLDDLFARPALTGTSPTSPAWSPRGDRLAFLWNDAGGAARELWLVDADGADPRRLTAAGAGGAGVGSFAWEPDGEALVFARGSALFRVTSTGEVTTLVELAERPREVRVAPRETVVSFLMAGDLWLFDPERQRLTQATRVAVPTISPVTLGRYARRDVEIGAYVWGGPTYAWSPDGRWIAVHYVDRRALPAVPFPDYLSAETEPNPVRRGYPGGANELRTVGLVRVADLALELLPLADTTSTRIVDFRWSEDGRLLIDRESDTAVERSLLVAEPGGGAPRLVREDRRDTRVYTLAGSAWDADGESVLYLGDLADRYGLYRVDTKSDQITLLSDPAFDVLAPPRVARNGAIFFETNEPGPHERHVYRLDPDGGAPRRVTTMAGENRAFPSPDGSRVAVLHSNDRQPTELYLIDDSGAARRVTTSTPPAFDGRAWADVRYVTFPSRVDGAELHARILTPPGLEPSARLPVLFGPVYSNTVRNRWAGRWAMLQQVLVSRGYCVVQVDVRGSTGYGRAFREAFLGDFAGLDLEDVESAVEFLKTQPYVDPTRFGIWGSSYGGTLTVYALLKKPGLFQAGVAGAAAVDPFFFGTDDVAIVRRPATDPEAFARGAAQFAGNLQDPLLLIHGMQDQVVPFKTVVVLAEELIRHGKDFDFAFAPAGTHGWTRPEHYGRFLLGKLLAHFDRHLRP